SPIRAMKMQLPPIDNQPMGIAQRYPMQYMTTSMNMNNMNNMIAMQQGNHFDGSMRSPPQQQYYNNIGNMPVSASLAAQRPLSPQYQNTLYDTSTYNSPYHQAA